MTLSATRKLAIGVTHVTSTPQVVRSGNEAPIMGKVVWRCALMLTLGVCLTKVRSRPLPCSRTVIAAVGERAFTDHYG